MTKIFGRGEDMVQRAGSARSYLAACGCIATPYRLKIAISFAAVGAVIGEFVAAQEGLGCMILMSTAQAKTPLAFASFVALTIISVVLFYAIELLERRFVTWSP